MYSFEVRPQKFTHLWYSTVFIFLMGKVILNWKRDQIRLKWQLCQEQLYGLSSLINLRITSWDNIHIVSDESCL
jgi:hypothetical protein